MTNDRAFAKELFREDHPSDDASLENLEVIEYKSESNRAHTLESAAEFTHT